MSFPPPLDERFIWRLKIFSRVASAFVILVGALVLTSWLFDIEGLKGVFGHITMKGNAALALLLAGVSLWTLSLDDRNPFARRAGQLCAAVVALIGALTLSQHIFGWNLGIDELFFTEPAGAVATTSPGRMGPPGSACFTLAGLALLLLHARRAISLAQIMSVVAGMWALLALIGYIYRTDKLYSIPSYTGISFHSAVAHFVLSLGLLAARAGRGILSVISSAGAGGLMARRLIIAAIGVPFLLGWFRLLAQQAGYYDLAFGTALLILALMVILTAIIWLSASKLNYLEQQHLAAEERFRLAVESAPNAMVMVDEEGRIVLVNSQTEQVFSYTREELMGQPVEMLVPERFRSRHQEYRAEFARLPQTRPMGAGRDLFGLRKDGSEVPIEIGLNPIRVKGQTLILSSILDITERKRAEEKLRASERLQRLLAQVGELGARVPEPEELTGAICERVATELGVSWCGLTLVDMEAGTFTVTKDYCGSLRSLAGVYPFSQYGDNNSDLFAGLTSVNEDMATNPRTADKYESVWAPMGLRANLSVPLHREGQLAAIFWVGHHEPRRWTEAEIELLKLIADRVWLEVERTRAEQSLTDRLHEIETVMEVLPVGLFIARDRAGSHIVGNHAARKFLRMDGGADANISLSAHPGEAPRHFKVFKDGREVLPEELPVQRAATQGIASHNLELDIVFDDGEVKYELINALPLFDGNGAPRGAVASAVDITERKLIEAELRRANQLKDEFLATISHELRTPLNAILGWASILRRSNLDEATVARALETIERNARAQAQLIEDLLDVSRITAGKLRLDVMPIDLTSVIKAAIDSVQHAADARGIQLQLVLDPAASRIRGDATRLQQVVWNLLSNSIKFTPAGGLVQVRLDRAGPDAQITVTDTGEGIDPEFLPYVFDRFQQADRTRTRKHGGLGLGLAIVRHIVELHGGTVEAHSPGIGLGASFSVRLPIAAERVTGPLAALPAEGEPQEVASIDAKSRLLQGLRILAVDDEPDTRGMVKGLLEQYGADVMTAPSARSAFEALPGFRPDVLVCDIGMPDEDGYSFIHKVRALQPEQGGNTPAIALTGYVRVEERARALEAGFQMFVPKPVVADELATMIANLVGRTDKTMGA